MVRGLKAKRWLALSLLALAGACAHIPQGGGSPDQVWASPHSLKVSTLCVVKTLDQYSSNEALKTVPHSVRVIEPNKVNLVEPRRQLSIDALPYYVRLERIDEQITRIALYDNRSLKMKPFIAALAKCGS